MRRQTVAAMLITFSALATQSVGVLGGDAEQPGVAVPGSAPSGSASSGSTSSGSTSSRSASSGPVHSSFAPVYTPEGRLKFPDGYREWIFLSSGLDMSYRERPSPEAHSVFDNVFVNPAAYQHFVRTGTWPEGTLLVMEERSATEKGSINQSGKFQSGDKLRVEAHVKDTKRFAGGWAFFAFGATEPAVQIPTSAECYSCHREHGAVDTTFVQFYPTLLTIARERRTLRSGQ